MLPSSCHGRMAIRKELYYFFAELMLSSHRLTEFFRSLQQDSTNAGMT